MKRVLITVLAGVAVFASGTAHAACGGTACLTIVKPGPEVKSQGCEGGARSEPSCCYDLSYDGESLVNTCAID